MVHPRNVLRSVISTLKLASVEPYMFFCVFGYTIRLATFQDLLIDSACRNLHLYPDEICENIDNYTTYKDAAIETGNNLFSAMMLFSSLPAIIVVIFLGPWSDKYSRKYPLLISACGLMVESSISAALTFYPGVSPVWYVVAAIFTGFTGGLLMGMSSAFSYMSDITDERSRPARYAIMEFANIAAVVLGSSLSGEIYKSVPDGNRVIMMLAPCSVGAALLYTIFFIKETKPKVKELKLSDMLRDLVTIENLKESYRTCSKKRPGNIRKQIWLLMWVSCTQKFVDMGIISIAFPFTRKMYLWDVTDFSHANTAFYIVNAFAIIVIVPILANKLRLHEAALGLIGMLSLSSKMVLNSVAYQQEIFIYAWTCGALKSAASIAIRARLSKLVHKDELGRAFSLLATCESVTPLLGTLAFVQIYNAAISTYPGLPFAIAALILVPCVIIFGWMMRLPTVSLGDYAREDGPRERALETFSSNYDTLKEENF